MEAERSRSTCIIWRADPHLSSSHRSKQVTAGTTAVIPVSDPSSWYLETYLDDGLGQADLILLHLQRLHPVVLLLLQELTQLCGDFGL